MKKKENWEITKSSNRGLWYFAHPYTGLGSNKPLVEAANYQLCLFRSAQLFELGYKFFSPVLHSHPVEILCPSLLILPEEERHKKLMDFDFTVCNSTNFSGIILAPKWEQSKGCKMEREYFEKKALEILLYEDIVKKKI